MEISQYKLKSVEGQNPLPLWRILIKKLDKIIQFEITKYVANYMLVHKKTWVRRLKTVLHFQVFYYYI